MQHIDAILLNEKLNSNDQILLIDIREIYEYNACNIGAKHIPMDEIKSHLDDIPKEKDVVLMCRSGKRAEAVANWLTEDFSFSNLFVLEGGILAWKELVDKTLDIE